MRVKLCVRRLILFLTKDFDFNIVKMTCFGNQSKIIFVYKVFVNYFFNGVLLSSAKSYFKFDYLVN